MPQVFKIGSYWAYLGTNENDPLEPVHVHVAEGSPQPNAPNARNISTITQMGTGCRFPQILIFFSVFSILCHNFIPSHSSCRHVSRNFFRDSSGISNRNSKPVTNS